jgi:hypothetical protein
MAMNTGGIGRGKRQGEWFDVVSSSRQDFLYLFPVSLTFPDKISVFPPVIVGFNVIVDPVFIVSEESVKRTIYKVLEFNLSIIASFVIALLCLVVAEHVPITVVTGTVVFIRELQTQ